MAYGFNTLSRFPAPAGNLAVNIDTTTKGGPLGLTVPHVNPSTKMLEVDSTIFENNIQDYERKTGLKKEPLNIYIGKHEGVHKWYMEHGYLPLDYVSANLHEVKAEAYLAPKNPALSAFFALDLWAQYPQTGPTATDWLSTMFKNAAGEIFGEENAANFINEYHDQSAKDEAIGKPTAYTYIELVAKYGQMIGLDEVTAEERLATNYANRLENA
jgi:hypothetical protein